MYGCKRLVDAGEGRVAEARIEKKYLVLDRRKLHEASILHCSATAVLQQCNCTFPLSYRRLLHMKYPDAMTLHCPRRRQMLAVVRNSESVRRTEVLEVGIARNR